MKGKILSITASLMLFAAICNAEIIKTADIVIINQEIKPSTLVLFNIAEVLMDTQTSLGSQAWRKYVRSRVDAKTHDEMTLFVFKNVPPKAPEVKISAIIEQLQKEGIPVFAFTSRGRHEWYSTQVANIDILTEELLRKIQIDFSRTKLPSPLCEIPKTFADYYHEGIIFATNSMDKGELLDELFSKTGYRPAKIVFIDDKADSLKSVEAVSKKYDIPFTGYAYARTALDHANFDPMIANIQLEWLMKHGQVLSDSQAADLKTANFANIDPDTFFSEIVVKWKQGFFSECKL